MGTFISFFTLLALVQAKEAIQRLTAPALLRNFLDFVAGFVNRFVDFFACALQRAFLTAGERCDKHDHNKSCDDTHIYLFHGSSPFLVRRIIKIH
jgi:hypothetical protein